jgi:hypothetical protein
MYVYTTYTRRLSVQASTADHALSLVAPATTAVQSLELSNQLRVSLLYSG